MTFAEAVTTEMKQRRETEAICQKVNRQDLGMNFSFSDLHPQTNEQVKFGRGDNEFNSRL